MLVVGAGPAGGDLSRFLAREGIDVLLIDQLADLGTSAFSSAAMPWPALEDFGLPAEVVGSRWSEWLLIGPGESRRHWRSPRPLGVVLDFGALRCWQADQSRLWGARVELGWRALACRADGHRMRTELRHADGRRLAVESDWVVDATGQARSLLGDPDPDQPGRRRPDPLLRGVGVEWLLEVSEPCWRAWAEKLCFCLGSDWVPQGYGWIFPMQPGLLKVGVCRFEDRQRAQPPLGRLLQGLLERLLGPEELTTVRVVDRHGGLVRSTIRRREPHRRGRLIGLGDAVSTANLLGGEGIRHALRSSRILGPLLLQTLEREAAGQAPQRILKPLDRYPKQLRQALGWRWSLSGRLARRTWLGLSDGQAELKLGQILRGLERERAEDLSALLFDYRFERYGLRALPYLLGWR